MFRILKTSKKSRARLTRLTTLHGAIAGPFFLPVATRGAVKHLSGDEVADLGAAAILANTYHLSRQPGAAVIRQAGGLHRFMHWRRPILTDSGGFQVFSLARHRTVTDDGVTFRDPNSGAPVTLTPESSLKLQQDFRVDIMMVLDECVGYPARPGAVATAVRRTTAWAERSRAAFRPRRRHATLPRDRGGGKRWARGVRPLLFGIVQGGTSVKLRAASTVGVVRCGFDGYAIGGLAVGEPRALMLETLARVTAALPRDRPRYLMGVGRPEEVVAAVRLGVDLFDCVIPTREARHGKVYVWRGRACQSKLRAREIGSKRLWYETFTIGAAQYGKKFKPIDSSCRCPCCQTYTSAYLHHLFRVREPLGQRLASLHNVKFYLDLMVAIRQAIRMDAL